MKGVNARILLWGIAGSGKSTTLRTIHDKLRSDLRGDLRLEPTRLDPTLQYEVLPITLGEVAGVATELEIVAVPGADEHAMTRKQLLDGVDGIILLIDSSPEKIEANIPAIEELKTSLAAYGQRLDAFPVVLQYNKRDVADPFAIEDLHRRIGLDQTAVFETIATTGHGILATLTTISKHVVRARRGTSQSSGSAAVTSDGAPADIHATTAAVIASNADLELLEPDEAEGAAESIADPAAGTVPAEPHDVLEAAILAEGEALADTDPAGDAGFPNVDDTAKADASPLGPELRVVSVGRAELAADGGVRLPLVLGDAAGRSRSVVLSLRLDALASELSD